MNRVKKELRKRGIKLECDYEYLPCDLGKLGGGALFIEAVRVDSEKAIVTEYYNVDVCKTIMDRQGEIWNYPTETTKRKGW